MSLANIYTELHRRARETATDRAFDLKGGARLAVRSIEGVTTLTISRANKKVGDVELATFRRDCSVPESAVRYPAESQGTKTRDGAIWYFVAYRWSEL